VLSGLLLVLFMGGVTVLRISHTHLVRCVVWSVIVSFCVVCRVYLYADLVFTMQVSLSM
jgi:hypothetical protein